MNLQLRLGHFGCGLSLGLPHLPPSLGLMVSTWAGGRETGGSCWNPHLQRSSQSALMRERRAYHLSGQTALLSFRGHCHFRMHLSRNRHVKLPTRRSSHRASMLTHSTFTLFYSTTNYCKRSDVKQYPFVMPQLCRSEVQAGLTAVSALAIRRSKSRCLPGWALTWRLWGRIHFQAHSGCWQNSVLLGCRTEVPIPLLALQLGSLQLCKATCMPFPVDPSVFNQ